MYVTVVTPLVRLVRQTFAVRLGAYGTHLLMALFVLIRNERMSACFIETDQFRFALFVSTINIAQLLTEKSNIKKICVLRNKLTYLAVYYIRGNLYKICAACAQ